MSHLYGSMILYIGIWYHTRMDRKNSSRKFPQQKNIMMYMRVQRSSTPTSNHPGANLCLFKFQSTSEFSKSEGSGCKGAKSEISTHPEVHPSLLTAAFPRPNSSLVAERFGYSKHCELPPKSTQTGKEKVVSSSNRAMFKGSIVSVSRMCSVLQFAILVQSVMDSKVRLWDHSPHGIGLAKIIFSEPTNGNTSALRWSYFCETF